MQGSIDKNPIRGFLKHVEEQKRSARLKELNRNPFIGKDEFNGNIIKIDGLLIAIDHWNPTADIVFISHAHMDHVPNMPPKDLELLKQGELKTKFICSAITKKVSTHRKRGKFDFPDENWLLGADLANHNSTDLEDLRFTLLESGHTYGSTSLLIEGSESIFYTGDFISEDRFFGSGKTPLNALKSLECDILIMECTFGTPNHVFPAFNSLKTELIDYCKKCLSCGEPVILLGYSFGKAQTLLNSLELEAIILLERGIAKITELLQENGMHFSDWEPYGNYNKRQLSKRGDYVLITPPYTMFSEPVKTLIKSGARIVSLSGKVLNSKHRQQFPADHYLPFSAHCDYNHLIEFMKTCRPKNVYLMHGQLNEFSYLLSKKDASHYIHVLDEL